MAPGSQDEMLSHFDALVLERHTIAEDLSAGHEKIDRLLEVTRRAVELKAEIIRRVQGLLAMRDLSASSREILQRILNGLLLPSPSSFGHQAYSD
ncbi:hypothetical protein EXIGLDRAFT_761982 [Exidia glandulosa HHB12029]|uniref:Uncharacterized protein n=1 Tax=Exidia glandulosa HHB12029 TaxID=1314781 RepID=A0A165N2J8_EXIGL|nr:hypothetical protein EXIGLDRAFT_761982 [Exidia glandulosa HHB12029]